MTDDDELNIVGMVIVSPWCARLARECGIIDPTDSEALNAVFLKWVYEEPRDDEITEAMIHGLPPTGHAIYRTFDRFIVFHETWTPVACMTKFQRSLQRRSSRWAKPVLEWAMRNFTDEPEGNRRRSMRRAAMVMSLAAWDLGRGVWREFDDE